MLEYDLPDLSGAIRTGTLCGGLTGRNSKVAWSNGSMHLLTIGHGTISAEQFVSLLMWCRSGSTRRHSLRARQPA